MNPVAPLLVVAGLGCGAVAGLRRGAARIDDRRSVLIHAPAAFVWERVRHVPDLILGFGRLNDYARLETPPAQDGPGDPEGRRCRIEGLWGGEPYWLEIDLARVTPPRRLELRLARDAFGTERGLTEHHGSLTIEADGAELTKLTWSLRARLKGVRLPARRLAAPAALRARLLDLGLRAIKVAVERDFVEAAAARLDPPDPPRPASWTPGPPPAMPRPPESTL